MFTQQQRWGISLDNALEILLSPSCVIYWAVMVVAFHIFLICYYYQYGVNFSEF